MIARIIAHLRQLVHHSHPSVATIARIVFLCAIFALPLSIRTLVVDASAWQLGFFNVFAAGWVSLSDVLFLTSFVLFGIALARGEVAIPKFADGRWQLTGGLMLALVVAMALIALRAPDGLLVVFQLWRVIGCVGAAVIIALGWVQSQHIIRVFAVAMGMQSVIGIAQFFWGGSLSLTFLGESQFTADTLNVAKIALPSGEVFVRAMGTLSHANVLGGMIALALILFISRELFARWWQYAVVALLTAGLFTTFSRAAWLATSIGLALFFISNWRVYVRPMAVIATVFAIGFAAYAPLIFARAEEVSADLARGSQLDIAMEMIAVQPLGVGMGQYVTTLARVHPELPAFALQPVHNVFALLAAEQSVVVACIFVLLILVLVWHAFRTRDYVHLAVLVGLITLAQFDHYLVTNAAAETMMWLIFGLACAQKNKPAAIG